MAEIDVITIRRILMCCRLRLSFKSINSEGKVESNKSILADKISTVYHVWHMYTVYIINWFHVHRIFSSMEQNTWKISPIQDLRIKLKAFHFERGVNPTNKYKYSLRFDKQNTKNRLTFYSVQRLKVQTFVVFGESCGNHAACFNQLILMENVRNAHLITHTEGF